MAIVINQTSYNGTPEDDSISGTSGNDTLAGAAGADTISGGNGNDIIYGNVGDDSLLGGAGNDTIYTGAGEDFVDGGSGTDRVFYTDRSNGVVINLAGAFAGSSIENYIVTDSIFNVEHVFGTEYGDVIFGGTTGEIFEGQGGNDSIDGKDGSDKIDFQLALAGVYVDLASGTSKDVTDQLSNTANDVANVGIDNFKNIERIEGSQYGDYLSAAGFGLTAGAWNQSTTRNTYNVLYGGRGNDTLVGNGNTEINFDFIATTSGVVVDLQLGTALSAWSGIDSIAGGITNVTGTKFADRVRGTDTNSSGETFVGLAGDDTFEGGGGYDTLSYGASSSGLSINMATGVVQGGVDVGRDTFSGVEQISGSMSADTYDASRYGLSASNGNIPDSDGLANSFIGRGGNDVIIGNGLTRVSFSGASAGVWASLAQGFSQDLYDVQNGTSLDAASIGIDTFTGANTLRGGTRDDVLIGGRRESDRYEYFQGQQGNDTIDGGSGFDRSTYQNHGVGQYFFIENGILKFAVNETGAHIYTTGLSVDMATGVVVGDVDIVGTDLLRSVESVFGTYLNDRYDATGFSADSANAGSKGMFNEFRGYAGNDTIIGNGHTRVNYGGSMAGVYVNLVTNESLDLLDKRDSSSNDLALVGNDDIRGGINQIHGSAFGDLLIGGVATNDLLEVFCGQGGDDTISGGSGFDRAHYNSAGHFTAWFNDGTQLILLEDGLENSPYELTQGVSVNLAAGTVAGCANYIGSDTLLGIESVSGTILADTYDATGFSGTSDNAGAYGTFNEFQGGAGNDRVIGNGNTRVSYSDANAGVLVNLSMGTSSGLVAGDVALVGVDTISGVNAVRGSAFTDVLIGSTGGDILEGRGGDDSMTGGAGNDRMDGGDGEDTAVYTGNLSSVISIGLSADGLSTIIRTTDEGTDTLTNIENIQFGLAPAMSVDVALLSFSRTPVFSAVKTDLNAVRSDGQESSDESGEVGNVGAAQAVDTSGVFLMPEIYSGPVAGIEFQLIDTSPDAVIVGSAFNDFIVLQGTGNKAVDGGGGANVIDGGTGSTFISGGGIGDSDTFFLDGRGLGTSWSTITDFELGLDKATIWGWKAGVSKVNADFTDFNTGGAAGYTGLTLHFENLLPDGSSATATNPYLNSITLTGLQLSDFGVSSLAELNTQLTNKTNSHFVVDVVSDVYGDHGYLQIL
jgi:Ca2+-binding RTX toxin-like protein